MYHVEFDLKFIYLIQNFRAFKRNKKNVKCKKNKSYFKILILWRERKWYHVRFYLYVFFFIFKN